MPLAVGLASACSAPRPESIDAGSDVSPKPCGNGVVDSFESCDDGPANGTATSLCTRQCANGHITLRAAVGLTLPFSVERMVSMDEAGIGAWAFTEVGAATLHIATNVQPQTATSSFPPYIDQLASVPLGAPATGLGRLQFQTPDPELFEQRFAPFWVEAAIPGVRGPAMAFATISSSGDVVVHDLPYPFADGAGGEVFMAYGYIPVIVDQSTGPNAELLIAVVLPRSMTNVPVITARLAAPASQRALAVDDGLWVRDLIDARDPQLASAYRIVQFYDDSDAFATIQVRSPLNDLWANTGSYDISILATGMWPHRPAVGATWAETSTLDGDVPLELQPLTHPQPIAIVTAAGDIYLWQFDHSPHSPEDFVSPFARAAPGSRIYSYGAGLGFLYVLAPDGARTVLVDSDNEDLRSPTLKPQLQSSLSPWTTAARPPAARAPWFFAADNRIYY